MSFAPELTDVPKREYQYPVLIISVLYYKKSASRLVTMRLMTKLFRFGIEKNVYNLLFGPIGSIMGSFEANFVLFGAMTARS